MSDVELARDELRAFEQSDDPRLTQLTEPVDPDPDYSQGIPVARDRRTDELIYIQFDGETRVGFFAPSGKGKTTFGKALISRLYDAGFKIFNGGDIKNDFQSLDYKGGASSSLIKRMGLADYEQPHRIPKKIFMPKFMVDAYEGKVPSYVEPFTLGFQDLSWTDLQFLLQPDSQAQKRTVKKLARQVTMERLADTDREIHGFALLRQKIMEMELGKNLERVMLDTIDVLEAEQIVGNQHREDPLQYLNEIGCPECFTTEFQSTYDNLWTCTNEDCDWKGEKENRVSFAISLGLERWREFRHGDMHKIQFYAAVLLRQLKERAKAGQITPPILGFWDEAHLLLPATGESLMTGPMQDLVDVAARQIEMPIVLSSQQPNKIPHSDDADILAELNHLFLGFDLDKKHWKAALDSMSLYRHYDADKWRRKMNRLKKYDFLYVSPEHHDSVTDCPIVRSLAPLCSHPG
ncbi:hypothetical protein [Halomontanus rarus]|uniref:hypothetical protein n=1 Tax=Halomontanus rarus TaxID=3034020 RepID=UPI001A995BAB